MYIVTFSAVIDVPIESFDVDGYRTILASYLSVSIDAITLFVSSATVIVQATIEFSDYSTALWALDQLSEISTTNATEILGVLILSIDNIELTSQVVRASPPLPSPPSPRSSKEKPLIQHPVFIAIISVSASLILVALLICVVNFYIQSRQVQVTKTGPENVVITPNVRVRVNSGHRVPYIHTNPRTAVSNTLPSAVNRVRTNKQMVQGRRCE